VRAHHVVVPVPVPGPLEGAEHLCFQHFVPRITCVMPIERIASSTVASPCSQQVDLHHMWWTALQVKRGLIPHPDNENR
jgi:hypothetical protein